MMAPVERVAVIDMGSNSWRLVVFGYEPGTPWWSLVDEIREPVRIGAGMTELSDTLQPERVDRALHTAAVFSAFCRAREIDRIEAVATSAIRDAANGEELLAKIRAQTGLSVRVITGTEEARYGWLAIANSTTIEDGFGLDIGGGSIQGVQIEDRRMVAAESLPLGSVRVSEEFLPGEKATTKGMRALRRRVTGDLTGLGWWQGGGRIVGIGGTIRNLAAAAMKRIEVPEELDVQGFTLTRDAVEELVDELARRPASKRGGVAGIKPDRGDVILGGALVLASAMEAGGFDAIEVTEAGLREGIFFERLLGARELFMDVRQESVENLAHRFDTDTEHVHHVATLSLAMFDGLAAAGLHELGAEERELLWAAGVLHDIGTAIDYDDHHRHSHYLILNAGLPGFSPRELVLVGLIARYHRKGDPDASELGDLAEPGDAKRLALLCGVIRLAEQLERSRDRSIRDIGVAAADGAVELSASTAPEGDPTVPIWAARRNADLLADAIGRRVEIEDAGARG
jgi:exopolyphosphatase/guanosine-5'-triphosphate,3'-diphosphate pyrophosphatase